MCSQLFTLTHKLFDNPNKSTQQGSVTCILPRSPPTFLATQSNIFKGRSAEDGE